MQFQDIECHEYEAEIHCDPGFPEMTEARVTVIVLELPEDRFRLPRPSFQFSRFADRSSVAFALHSSLKFPNLRGSSIRGFL